MLEQWLEKVLKTKVTAPCASRDIFAHTASYQARAGGDGSSRPLLSNALLGTFQLPLGAKLRPTARARPTAESAHCGAENDASNKILPILGHHEGTGNRVHRVRHENLKHFQKSLSKRLIRR